MATLASLAADVYTLTNRPDLVAETLLSLKKAIRKFHGADFFKRDLATHPLNLLTLPTVTADVYKWEINLPDLTRFRKVKTIASLPVCEFVELAPDDLFDGYGYEKPWYWLVAGSVLTLKSASPLQSALVYYYQWPDIPADTGGTLSSWIVNEYPDAVVEEAASAVFKMIGKDEEYNRFNELFTQNLAIIRGTDI